MFLNPHGNDEGVPPQLDKYDCSHIYPQRKYFLESCTEELQHRLNYAFTSKALSSTEWTKNIPVNTDEGSCRIIVDILTETVNHLRLLDGTWLISFAEMTHLSSCLFHYCFMW